MSPEFLLAALFVVLAPGTGVIYTLATGLTQGNRAAVAAAFGCTLGIIAAMAAAMLGLTALLHTSALAFQALKFAGVAFLLHLAWSTLRDRSVSDMAPGTERRPVMGVVFKGAALSVLNPKLSLFFLAFLPQFLSGNAATARAEILTLGGVFMLMTFVVFVGYGAFAAQARDRLLKSPRALTWMRRAVAASFAGLGRKPALERA